MIPMCRTPRWKLEIYKTQTAIECTVPNTRQLGGYLLKNGRRVKADLLIRSAQLHDAAKDDLQMFKERYHVSRVIDLRSAEEIEKAPDPMIEDAASIVCPMIDYGVFFREMEGDFREYQNCFPQADLTKYDPDTWMDVMITLARMSRKTGRGYMNTDGGAYARHLAAPAGQKCLGRFFQELASLEEGAILWHCISGKDRTGIAAALVLEVLGAEWDTILADYEMSNLCFAAEIADMQEKFQNKGCDEEDLPLLTALMAGTHAIMLEKAWEYMKTEWGSPIRYLEDACDVSEEALNRIRYRYTEDSLEF